MQNSDRGESMNFLNDEVRRMRLKWSASINFPMYFHHIELMLKGHYSEFIVLGVETGTWPLWAPHDTDSTGEKGDDWMARGWLILNEKGEIKVASTQREKWGVWKTGDFFPVGHFLILSRYVSKVHGKLQQSVSVELLMAQTLQGWELGSHHQAKNYNQWR